MRSRAQQSTPSRASRIGDSLTQAHWRADSGMLNGLTLAWVQNRRISAYSFPTKGIDTLGQLAPQSVL